MYTAPGAARRAGRGASRARAVPRPPAHLSPPQNKVLASAGDDGSVCLSSDSGTRDLMASEREHGSDAVALSLAFSGGSRFLGAGGDDGIVRVWDLSLAGRPRRVHAHTSAVSCVCWSAGGAPGGDAPPDQPLLLTAGSELGEITTHVLAEGKPPACASRLVLSSGAQPVSCSAVQFSPLRPAALASADSSGAVRLWDLAAARGGGGDVPLAAHEFREHAGGCAGLGWSCVNQLLLCSVGQDGQLLFYDTLSRSPVKAVQLGEPLSAVAFLADGVTVAVGSEAGAIHVFDLRMSLAPMRSAQASGGGPVLSLAFQHLRAPTQTPTPAGHGARARERPGDSRAADEAAPRRAAATEAANDPAERAARPPREGGGAAAGRGAARPGQQPVGARGSAGSRQPESVGERDAAGEGGGSPGERRSGAQAGARESPREPSVRRPFREVADNDGATGAPSSSKDSASTSAEVRAEPRQQAGAQQHRPDAAAHGAAPAGARLGRAQPEAAADALLGAAPATPRESQLTAAPQAGLDAKPARARAAAGPAAAAAQGEPAARGARPQPTPWLVATTARKTQRNLLSPHASAGAAEQSGCALRHMPVFAESGDTPSDLHSPAAGGSDDAAHRRAAASASPHVRAPDTCRRARRAAVPLRPYQHVPLVALARAGCDRA